MHRCGHGHRCFELRTHFPYVPAIGTVTYRPPMKPSVISIVEGDHEHSTPSIAFTTSQATTSWLSTAQQRKEGQAGPAAPSSRIGIINSTSHPKYSIKQ